MVIDGNKLKRSDLKVVEFREGRFHLPKHLIEIAGFKGKEKIGCQFLVVTAGRYRLVTRPVADGDLSRVVDGIERVGEVGDVLDYTDDNRKAGIRARLIDCNVAPQGDGWRIYVPEELQLLMPENENRKFIFVFTVAGFIEIWFPDTLARAVSVPISDLLR
jgi:hypothetical protein